MFFMFYVDMKVVFVNEVEWGYLNLFCGDKSLGVVDLWGDRM